MGESIKQIGQRLKGLREVLDIPAEEVAELCGVTLDHYLKMEEGELGKKGLIKFNISQLVCHLICWLAVAPVLDVYMMGEPWDKLIAQGLMAAVANAVTTAIVGSLLCIAYAATKTKAGSLTKE